MYCNVLRNVLREKICLQRIRISKIVTDRRTKRNLIIDYINIKVLKQVLTSILILLEGKASQPSIRIKLRVTLEFFFYYQGHWISP